MNHWAAHHGRVVLAAIALAAVVVTLAAGCREDPPEPAGGHGGAEPSADAMSRYDGAAGRVTQRVDVVRAVAPAPKPTGPLAAGASCVTAACHARLGTAARVHAPVGAGQCEACHEPDAGGHVYPLKRAGSATCTFCHVLPARAHEHPPVREPGCVACHDPHASESRALMVESTVGRVCATCHNLPLNRFAHKAFADGECELCHEPHGAANAKLLRGGAGSAACLSCHKDLADRMAGDAFTHSPALQGDCTRCHQPHTSPQPKLLVASMEQLCFGCHENVERRMATAKLPHGAVEQPGKCANCHDAHAASQPYLLVSRQDAMCLGCHSEPQRGRAGNTIASVAGELSSPFLHGPVRSADCSACHEAHGADHPYLLDQPYPRTFYAAFDVSNYGLCFECHDKRMVLEPKTEALTDFRDGDRNLHVVHVNRKDKGRTCRTCHEVHGSSHPRHIADAVPFEDSSWAMPIGFEKQDDGGSCSPGCHEPMRYRRGPAATAPVNEGGP